MNTGKVINLVLDQLGREQDLYYNIRLLCNVPFVDGIAKSEYAYKSTWEIPN